MSYPKIRSVFKPNLERYYSLLRCVAGGLLALASFLLSACVPIATAAPIPPPTEITDDKGVEMRLVPQGEFTMGDSPDNAYDECMRLDGHCMTTFNDEAPPHQVYLDAYYLDTYEVTNKLYKACVDAGWWRCTAPGHNEPAENFSDHYGDSQFDSYPVVDVTWSQARAYCEWRGARLPTEAEWEKAARGTDGRAYPWGSVFDGTKTNFCDKNCKGVSNSQYDDGYAEAAPVGSYPQGVSPYGIYDLAGNVMEWTADWYDENYYSNSPSSNPQGPAVGQDRTLRDGSWRYSGNNVRSADRSWSPPRNFMDDLGFRCARSVP